MADVLYFESCDFKSFPQGGQLSFARQMMEIFGNRLALVGISTDDTPIGRWVKKDFNGTSYCYFSFGKRKPSAQKPIVPERIKGYCQLSNYRKEILSLGVKNAFTRSTTSLMPICNWGWDSLCYYPAGLNNPLDMPRYRWGKLFRGIFFKKTIQSMERANVVIAAADQKSIDNFVAKSEGRLVKTKIIKFPTRVNTRLFRPMNKDMVRKELNIKKDDIIIVNCGRINIVKGWDFLLKTFRIFLQSNRNAQLILVGDGEDRKKLESCINGHGFSSRVKVTGFQQSEQVVKYLNAADVVVVTSHREGWSIAILEALACGKPIISTDVSGAKDMIIDGKNGFIIEKRDPHLFADAIGKAISLKGVKEISLNIAGRFSLNTLARDLGDIWSPLA